MKRCLSAIALAVLLCLVPACEDDATNSDLQRFRAEAEATAANTESVRSFLAAVDRVAVTVMQRGAQRAAWKGIAATGTEVTVPGAYFLRVRNGRVQELWLLEDKLGLHEQLGLELRAKGQR